MIAWTLPILAVFYPAWCQTAKIGNDRFYFFTLDSQYAQQSPPQRLSQLLEQPSSQLPEQVLPHPDAELPPESGSSFSQDVSIEEPSAANARIGRVLLPALLKNCRRDCSSSLFSFMIDMCFPIGAPDSGLVIKKKSVGTCTVCPSHGLRPSHCPIW